MRTVHSNNKAGHGEYLKDASQDEPTVVHSTQSLTQNENDDDARIDGEVTSKDQDENPRRTDNDTKEANKTAADDDDDDDSSSGPFFKGNVGKNTTKKVLWGAMGVNNASCIVVSNVCKH